MAVTVDDLPADGALPRGATRLAIAVQVIRALRQHAVPDVYGFANGGPLQSNPELEGVLRAWRQAGFLLGNHTFSHSDLTSEHHRLHRRHRTKPGAPGAPSSPWLAEVLPISLPARGQYPREA